MTKNRKKSETFRFNGNPFLHSHSIHSFEISELEVRIQEFRRKLNDPEDTDDKKWTQRWLDRFESEHSKKVESRETRTLERSKQIDRETVSEPRESLRN